MTKLLLKFGIGLVLSLNVTPATLAAVQSAPVQEDSPVAWSQVINDPFDGSVVYDKHFTNRFAFISSWSKQGIRATYVKKDSILIGYETVWETRWVPDAYCDRRKSNRCKSRKRQESYPTQRAVYREVRTDLTPRRILLAVRGQVYTYESGSVSPDLAMALSNAPDENTRIRLEWENGGTSDIEIGKGTVKAWRTIFKVQK
ncbi:MAG: hypothetical protein KME43_06910 [Myxacorys chilensis ATA2-1-KO14]|nr:hypothetical protein [Myxacorys chilensis ATA2-1-KO14]